MKTFLFSNEIVFRGHPDKVCDQISDAILDACLAQDPYTRCGVEVMGGKKAVYITGEITTAAKVYIPAIAQRVLADVGYDPSIDVIVDISQQSADIALGTNRAVGGAGDNGMMFGYACNETKQQLPKAMVILQEFARQYDALRKTDPLVFLPDGKAQITGAYDAAKRLQYIKSFTICYQNAETNRDHTDGIVTAMARDIAKQYGVTRIDDILINPTGRFNLGGFAADAGLTGRKIVVDNYQGFAPVGGGAFSGKDPSKVDRSGAYKARQLAQRWLKQYNLEWCEVQLSYSIGVARPMAIYVRTNLAENPVEITTDHYIECEPINIIYDLGLLNPLYERLACYGHFQ